MDKEKLYKLTENRQYFDLLVEYLQEQEQDSIERMLLRDSYMDDVRIEQGKIKLARQIMNLRKNAEDSRNARSL